MSGKPAARQGDMTQYGGPIVQGSAGVRIGAPTGVACSVCPGGMTSGNPVNPLLGAKVLPGETDLALPARAAVHSLPHLQQLPDEDACTGGRFRPRLESAF
ncbi:protein rhsD domain protein [Escherichia coli G58-1]|nr:protein rhsD domain protein [Escherichia coli G58-1]